MFGSPAKYHRFTGRRRLGWTIHSKMKPSCEILVVEDDRVLRESLRESLEEEGYVVETAENGLLEAVERHCAGPRRLESPTAEGQ